MYQLLFFISLLVTSCCYAEAVEKPTDDKCDYAKLKKNDPPLSLEGMLSKSVQEACPELMEAILKNEKEVDVFKASSSFIKTIADFILKEVDAFKGKAEEDPETVLFQNQLKSMAPYKDFLKEKCPDEKGTTDACKAYKSFMAFGDKLSKKMNALLSDEKKQDEISQKKALENSPEHMFKMKYCKNQNLGAVLFVSPVPIEPNCIYQLKGRGWRLYVIQSISDGILVAQPNHALRDKVVFIQTKKAFADNDMVQNMYVKSNGLKKYLSVVGSQKTVNSFQYLGDDESGDDEWR